MALIIPLAEAGKYSVEQVGGKAYNLGKLIQAGFAVPIGFVALPDAEPSSILPLLGGGLWAVRSSAVAEDSGGQSFAGQHESFLNITAADVPEKIAACRASSQSLAAQAYRQGQGPSRMAVIVQKMVVAQASGVAFTVDPVTGNSKDLHVEMVSGLGDVLVGGMVAPKSLIIPRNYTLLPSQAIFEGFPIPKEAILELGHLILQVETFLGAPQDIEWAYADQKFWLLQARPITTSTLGWTRANIGEVMPGVVTPVTWSIFQTHVTGKPDGDETALRLIESRAHLNESMMLRSFEWLVWADAEAVCRALGMEMKPNPHRHSLLEWAASLLFLFDLLSLTHRLEGKVRRFQQLPRPANPSPTGDYAAQFATWDAWTAQAFRLHLYTTTYAIGAYGLLVRQIKKRPDQERTTLENSLLQQLTASRSADIPRALQSLGDAAKQAGLAPEDITPENIPGWDAFLDEYGDRCAEEFELHTPRWRETPDVVLGLVRQAMRRPRTRLTTQECLQTKGTFSRLVKGYHRFVALREAMKHEVICGYGALRLLCLQAGKQLTANKTLSATDDVFFLSKKEIVAILTGSPIPEELPARIATRRAEFKRRTMPQIHQANDVSQAASAVLHGIGCSRGVVEGRARVLSVFTADVAIEPDEILVVPQADPGWTPLFLSAAGVVADVGGFLSHSATVAREFGIPAVFNVPLASRRLHNGQRLRLDGGTGMVEILG
jgi:pyruvate,water dikinase